MSNEPGKTSHQPAQSNQVVRDARNALESGDLRILNPEVCRGDPRGRENPVCRLRPTTTHLYLTSSRMIRERILGVLTAEHHHALEEPQRWAWLQQISILKASLAGRPNGRIFLEFYIPRMGKRADAVLIDENIVFVIEFKAGATRAHISAFDQVEDYALDLKNFHEGSHTVPIVPVLVSTNAESQPIPELQFADDLVASPVGTNKADLGNLIDAICAARAFPKSQHR